MHAYCPASVCAPSGGSCAASSCGGQPPEVRVVFAADDVGTADQGAVCDASVRILPALARRRAGNGHAGGVYPHLAVPVVPHCDVEMNVVAERLWHLRQYPEFRRSMILISAHIVSDVYLPGYGLCRHAGIYFTTEAAD